MLRRILKAEGKRLLGRWEDNIKMDFTELGSEDVDWIQLAQKDIQ
jgi:hypothetical protein